MSDAHFEFISYKEYPEDSYISAIARVRVDKKHAFHYGKKRMKDGSGFWSRASFGVTESGEKKYFKDKLSDEFEEEKLVDFIKEEVKKLTSGVAENDELPF